MVSANSLILKCNLRHRKIYNENKIWPSFIGLPLETAGGMKKKAIGGSTMEQQLAENLGTSSSCGIMYMPLPVFLWKEQYRYAEYEFLFPNLSWFKLHFDSRRTILAGQQDKDTQISPGKKRKLECEHCQSLVIYPHNIERCHADNLHQMVTVFCFNVLSYNYFLLFLPRANGMTKTALMTIQIFIHTTLLTWSLSLGLELTSHCRWLLCTFHKMKDKTFIAKMP